LGIIQPPQVLPGQVGVIGAIKYMVTTDSIATVTTAGYLNNLDLAVFPIAASDVLGITYSYNTQTQSGIFTFANITITNGVITIAEMVSPGNVLLPVVSGDFAIFNGTTGQIKDSSQKATNIASPYLVTSPGSLTAGNFPTLADANGTLAAGLPPSAASQAYVVTSPGSLTSGNFPTVSDAHGTLAAGLPPSASSQVYVVVSPGGLTSGNLLKTSDTHGTLADSGIVATSVATSTITNPDPSSDLIWYDVTCTAAALATAGKVNIQVSSGSKQYKVRNVLVNYAAAGLSGGGGDRLLAITDGTTVYNNAGITAALLGTPINTVWGGTGNPLPGTVAMNTPSVAGANIYAQYSGGTTDYTTGSVIISVLVQRVA
jgi:hypothetical protein